MEDDELEGMEAAMITGNKIKENILGLVFGTQFLSDSDIENTLL